MCSHCRFLNNFVIQFDKYSTLFTNFWEELSQGTATGLAIVFPFSVVIPHSSVGKMLTRDKQVHHAAFPFFSRVPLESGLNVQRMCLTSLPFSFEMVNSCCPRYQCCRYLIFSIALIFGLISALKASLHSMSN